MQATLTKALEHGRNARADTLKGWLFRVAFHEAMLIRRRQRVDVAATRRLADLGRAARKVPTPPCCAAKTPRRCAAPCRRFPKNREAWSSRAFMTTKRSPRSPATPVSPSAPCSPACDWPSINFAAPCSSNTRTTNRCVPLLPTIATSIGWPSRMPPARSMPKPKPRLRNVSTPIRQRARPWPRPWRCSA